jgi:hypothetical protein
MNASGQVRVAHADSALYVPVEALMTMNDQKYLLVAEGVTLPQASGGSGNNSFGGRSAGAEGGAIPAMGQGVFARGQGSDGQETTGQVTSDINPGNFQGFPAGGQGVPEGAPADFQQGQGLPDDAPSRSQNAQEDAQEDAQETELTSSLRSVTVGMVNDDYAEILSGVSVGEIVLYQSSENGDNANMFRMRDGGIAMPMMGF